MRRTLLALLALLVPAPALAVPIGTTPDTRPAAPQQRRQWQDVGLSLEVAGNMLQGNAALVNVNAVGALNANQGPHQFFLDAGAAYTRAGAATLVQRLSGSALYAYGVRDNLNLYGYTTHSTDLPGKLDYRLSAGVGACLHRILAPDFPLFLLSWGPATELDWSQGVASAPVHRSVLRVNAIRPLTEGLEIGEDAFYMPAFTDLGDYRLYGELFLKVKLADGLSLKLTAADEFNSRPKSGAQPNDFGIFTSLAAEWGH